MLFVCLVGFVFVLIVCCDCCVLFYVDFEFDCHVLWLSACLFWCFRLICLGLLLLFTCFVCFVYLLDCWFAVYGLFAVAAFVVSWLVFDALVSWVLWRWYCLLICFVVTLACCLLCNWCCFVVSFGCLDYVVLLFVHFFNSVVYLDLLDLLLLLVMYFVFALACMLLVWFDVLDVTLLVCCFLFNFALVLWFLVYAYFVLLWCCGSYLLCVALHLLYFGFICLLSWLFVVLLLVGFACWWLCLEFVYFGFVVLIGF